MVPSEASSGGDQETTPSAAQIVDELPETADDVAPTETETEVPE